MCGQRLGGVKKNHVVSNYVRQTLLLSCAIFPFDWPQFMFSTHVSCSSPLFPSYLHIINVLVHHFHLLSFELHVLCIYLSQKHFIFLPSQNIFFYPIAPCSVIRDIYTRTEHCSVADVISVGIAKVLALRW